MLDAVLDRQVVLFHSEQLITIADALSVSFIAAKNLIIFIRDEQKETSRVEAFASTVPRNSASW